MAIMVGAPTEECVDYDHEHDNDNEKAEDGRTLDDGERRGGWPRESTQAPWQLVVVVSDAIAERWS